MYFGRRLVIGCLFTYENIIILCDYGIFCDKYFAVFIHYFISSMANCSNFQDTWGKDYVRLKGCKKVD